MESNREEAEKCVELADEALRAFKSQRAKNLLNKAQKLFPTQRAKGR